MLYPPESWKTCVDTSLWDSGHPLFFGRIYRKSPELFRQAVTGSSAEAEMSDRLPRIGFFPSTAWAQAAAYMQQRILEIVDALRGSHVEVKQVDLPCYPRRSMSRES